MKSIFDSEKLTKSTIDKTVSSENSLGLRNLFPIDYPCFRSSSATNGEILLKFVGLDGMFKQADEDGWLPSLSSYASYALCSTTKASKETFFFGASSSVGVISPRPEAMPADRNLRRRFRFSTGSSSWRMHAPPFPPTRNAARTSKTSVREAKLPSSSTWSAEPAFGNNKKMSSSVGPTCKRSFSPSEASPGCCLLGTLFRPMRSRNSLPRRLPMEQVERRARRNALWARAPVC